MSKGNMRLISIVVIIVLFVAAWYTLISDSIKNTVQYNQYLSVAREKSENELYDDAQDNYNSALAMKDTIELRDEIAEFYIKAGKTSNYVGFVEQTIETFPYEKMGYERMIEYYKDTANYYTCFSMVETAKKRGVESDKINKIVEELAYKYELTHAAFETVQTYSSGFYAVKKSNGLWGYINAYGSTKIQFSYTEADCFTSSGLAAVRTQDGKYFLIDTSNRKKVVDTEDKKIEDCTNLISGKIAVKYNGKYHYCDSEFNELFGEYDYAGAFCCGVAAVKEGNEWHIINENGKYVTDSKFEDIKVDDKGVAFRNNVAFAKINGKYILVDTNGKQVGSELWDDADAFNSEQPAAVKKGELWGFVDSTGKVVLTYKYNHAKSFSNGLAAFCRNNKWGYIETEFKEVIEPAFMDANDFNDCGSSFVLSNNKWTLLKIFRLSKQK